MASIRPSNTTHILNLAENKHGYDFVIGDLHGTLLPLTEACRYLERASDRLMIAGDLLDRGKENTEVIQFILEYNDNDNKPGKIYSVCGNHELMYQQTIAACENIIKENPEVLFGIDFSICNDMRSYESMCKIADTLINAKKHDAELVDAINQLKLHCNPANGGAWLLSLFNQEFDNDMIRLDANRHIIYEDQSKIKLIRDYISSLPVIIHVGGTNPFLVVHASMPVDDWKLKRLMEDNLGLTDEEIEYAVLARPDHTERPITDIGRHPWSIIVYVGHTIIDDRNLSKCIDTKTNTVFLDTASYFTGISVVINHLNNQCMFTESVIELLRIPEFRYLSDMVEMVQMHLGLQNELCIQRLRDAKLREMNNIMPRQRTASSK